MSARNERPEVEASGRFDHRKPGRPAPISAADQARLMPRTFETGKTIEELLAEERATAGEP